MTTKSACGSVPPAVAPDPGDQLVRRVLRRGALLSLQVGSREVERPAVGAEEGDELDLRMTGALLIEILAHADKLGERNPVADRQLDIRGEEVRHRFRLAEDFRSELGLEKDGRYDKTMPPPRRRPGGGSE
jgi:hypothetical protein